MGTIIDKFLLADFTNGADGIETGGSLDNTAFGGLEDLDPPDGWGVYVHRYGGEFAVCVPEAVQPKPIVDIGDFARWIFRLSDLLEVGARFFFAVGIGLRPIGVRDSKDLLFHGAVQNHHPTVRVLMIVDTRVLRGFPAQNHQLEFVGRIDKISSVMDVVEVAVFLPFRNVRVLLF